MAGKPQAVFSQKSVEVELQTPMLIFNDKEYRATFGCRPPSSSRGPRVPTVLLPTTAEPEKMEKVWFGCSRTQMLSGAEQSSRQCWPTRGRRASSTLQMLLRTRRSLQRCRKHIG